MNKTSKRVPGLCFLTLAGVLILTVLMLAAEQEQMMQKTLLSIFTDIDEENLLSGKARNISEQKERGPF